MKILLQTIYALILLGLAPFIALSQGLDVAGEVKIGTMPSDNLADSIVVRQADGTLALRDVSTILEFQVVNQSNDTLHLSNGDFIELISGFDGQYSSLTGAPTTLSSFTNDPGYLTSEADAGWTMVDDTTYIMKYVGIGTDSPNEQLHVAGKVKIDTMLLDNTADSIVVRQSDGTLALRDISTLPSSGGSGSSGTYHVGQLMGTDGEDGVVFWVDHTGEDGLIVSKDDLSILGWSNGSFNTTSALSQFDGALNTSVIILNQLAGTYAAKTCADYSTANTAIGDWYLPSIDELMLIFNSKYLINKTLDENNFDFDYYWSSTERNNSLAYAVGFEDGLIESIAKSSTYVVRPIRRIKAQDHVQARLDNGESPLSIVASGQPLDSLYGKMYEGGLIFYLDNQDTIMGIKGLVAAPYGWSGGGDDPLAEWGCEGTQVTAFGVDIGQGAQNTANALISCGSPGTAAVICNATTVSGKTDWFLPSINEAEQVWLNLHRFGCPKDSSPCSTSKGGALDDVYWTSTENVFDIFDAANSAMIGDNSSGNPGTASKSTSFRVRPIRAF